MERVILDVYDKQEKHLWGKDPNTPFNQKISAVNDMYGWLYNQGILRNVSFEIKDYDDAVYFAFDAQKLKPYRVAMAKSGIKNAELAIHHIFNETYTPCIYSGAIELGWTMATYRDVDGCVGRSWECGLIKGLNTKTIYEISKVREERGVKEAVTEAFKLAGFEPDLFDKAFEHYSKIDPAMSELRGYLESHSNKLISCFQNDIYLDLLDVDFWVQYEELLHEQLTFDEYRAIDGKFDGDPHDIEPTNTVAISQFKKDLEAFRWSQSKPLASAPQKVSLLDKIKNITDRLANRKVSPEHKVDDYTKGETSQPER